MRKWFTENLQLVAWGLICLSVIMVLYLLAKAGLYGYTIGRGEIDFAATGQVGDFIGGFVGTIINAAAFLFLYLTLKEQRVATNEQRLATNDQRRSFEKERLESKFFDLIKMHRDNVAELRMRSVKIVEQDGGYKYKTLNEEGKAVFKDVFYQFVDCFNELRLFFNKLDRIYEPNHRAALESSLIIGSDKRLLGLMAKVDICYSIVYYGVGSEGLITLYKIFEGRYKEHFINDILRYISLKPSDDDEILRKWSKIYKRGFRPTKLLMIKEIYDWRKSAPISAVKTFEVDNSIEELAVDYHNKYTKYYGGHQFRLGHYFRQLYQTVKFINNQQDIKYKEKYDYIKILRAQLSNYEQAVLFLNSLSSLGRAWEFHPEINSELTIIDRRNFELITKYNMIKNLPGETMYGIPFKMFYPNVEFEGKKKNRDNSIYQ